MIVAQEKPNYGYAERPIQSVKDEPGVRANQVQRHDRAWCLVTAGMLMMAFVLGVAINYVNYQVAGVGYRLTTLQKQVVRMETENQHLEAALGRLDSLERVETIATKKLGMVVPTESNVMYIALDQSVDEPDAKVTAAQQNKSAGTSEQGLAMQTAGADEQEGLWRTLLRVICQNNMKTG